MKDSHRLLGANTPRVFPVTPGKPGEAALLADVDPRHPKQKLLFFVAQELNADIGTVVRDFVADIASSRAWVNGSPRFAHCREDVTDEASGDEPIETVGGYLEIHSALPPWTLPQEIDRLEYDDTAALVNALRDLSREHKLAIELELDGTYVGSITDGELDKLLSEGLLGQWGRELGLSD